jgi:CRP-like cAMP-binding protein
MYATREFIARYEAIHGPLPHVERLFDAVRVLQLQPRESAFREDEECPRLYLVRTGLLKQSYTSEDGSEWIKSFAREGDLFACPLALTRAGRTTFASIAIERSVVEFVDWQIIDALAETDLAWQRAIRLGFQRLAELKVRRERDLLMLTAEALYHQFAAQSSDLIDRIPQKDPAAFIGVTPVGLNRIIRRQALSSS